MILAQRKKLSDTCAYLENALDNLAELYNTAGVGFNDSLLEIEAAIDEFLDDIYERELL